MNRNGHSDLSWSYNEYDDWLIMCVYLFLVFREEEMQLLNRSTTTKMATFSILSLGVCLSVAALQLWHLKTFFERKKLLWFFSHSLFLIYSSLTNYLLVLFFSFLKTSKFNNNNLGIRWKSLCWAVGSIETLTFLKFLHYYAMFVFKDTFLILFLSK